MTATRLGRVNAKDPGTVRPTKAQRCVLLEAIDENRAVLTNNVTEAVLIREGWIDRGRQVTVAGRKAVGR